MNDLNDKIEIRKRTIFIMVPLISIFVFIFGLGAGYAYLKSNVANNERRINNVEQRIDKLETEYMELIKDIHKRLGKIEGKLE